MILACQNISKAFGTEEILKNVSFHIEENEKAGIVGINGAGKTTLLKIIMGELSSDSGEVILGKGKTVGYLAQYQDISGNNSILQEVLSAKAELIAMEEQLRGMEDAMHSLSGEELNLHLEKYNRLHDEFTLKDGYAYRSEVTGVIRGLGFSEEDFDRNIATLSGGEKTRVALGKLLVVRPDVLILDEPTNHLDITSKEILESALNQYTGTVFFVSHDRYFINRTATRILDLTGETVVNYIGNYDYYLEKKDDFTKIYVAEQTKEVKGETGEAAPAAKVDWQSQKAEQARIRKIENSLKRTEEQIERLEAQIAEIDEQFVLPENAVNSAKLNELSAKQSACRSELEKCYEQWEELSMELDS